MESKYFLVMCWADQVNLTMQAAAQIMAEYAVEEEVNGERRRSKPHYASPVNYNGYVVQIVVAAANVKPLIDRLREAGGQQITAIAVAHFVL